MGHRRWITLAAAVVAVFNGTCVRAEPTPIDVRVRVYDGASVGAETLGPALVAASAAMSSVAVRTTWQDCTRPAGVIAPSGPCASPLGKGELALRIVRLAVPPAYEGRLPLGDSLIDRNSASGVLATIYYDRVLWLARASRTSVTSLLARAVAHELGHLLIGSERHDDHGLMRAVWKREDLQRNRTADWVFTPEDAAAIHGRQSGRHGSIADRNHFDHVK